MEEYVSRWLALPKSSDNTLAASTLAWLKMATEMTKMIKRVLVFLEFIFGEEVACWDLWTWISSQIKIRAFISTVLVEVYGKVWISKGIYIE